MIVLHLAILNDFIDNQIMLQRQVQRLSIILSINFTRDSGLPEVMVHGPYTF